MKIHRSSDDVTITRLVPLFIVLFLISFISGNYYFQGDAYQSYPRGFYAGDAYFDLLRIDHIREVGNLNYQPKVLVAFRPEPFTTHDSPVMYYSASWFADVFGLESHVAVHVLMVFALLMEIAVVFVLLSRVNWVLAWLSLPFSLAALQLPFISGINWGLWKAYYSFYIFFLLALFYPIRLDWRAIFCYSLVFSSLILAYPFDGIYALVLLAFSLAVSRVDGFGSKVLKFLAVGIISSLLFVNYFMDYISGFYPQSPGGLNPGFLLSMLGSEVYRLPYFAESGIYNLGIWFWISLLGFGLTIFLLVKDWKKIDRYPNKLLAVFSIIYFFYFLEPYFPRLMKFRDTWPIMIGVFVGCFLYLLLVAVFSKGSRNGRSQAEFETLGYITFIILMGVFLGTYFKLPDESESVVSKDLYSAHMYLKDKSLKNATVLLIDPFQDQDVDTLLSGRNVRYLTQQSFKNLSSLGYDLSAVPTSRFCAFPIWLRQGFRIIEYNVSGSLCQDRFIKPCQNDYVIMNMHYNSSEEWAQNWPREGYDTLQILLQRLLADGSFTIINSTKTTYVLKNNRSCGSWAAD